MNNIESKETGNDKLCQLIDIIANRHNIKVEKLSLSTNFKNDLGIDSLEIIEMVIDIERIFKISISHEEQKKIETIGNVLNVIEKHHGK